MDPMGVGKGGETRPLLEVHALTKDFAGQRALDNVDLRIDSGKVRALVGQNGCGKSTLIKTLAGYHEPAATSEFTFLGEPLDVVSPSREQRSKMHFIHQNLGLVESLSTLDNLAMGRGYTTSRSGRIRWHAEEAQAVAMMHSFDFDFDVRVPVGDLTPVEQTMVGILRALRGWTPGPALLVLDEPTAALPLPEVDQLFAAIRRLTAQGAGVLYVSHRLEEVLSIADDVTVLRDGKLIADRPTEGLDHDLLVELMVGRTLSNLYTPPPPPSSEPIMQVDQLSGSTLQDLTFTLHKKEILGITGIHGSGRDEVSQLIFGAVPATGGRVTVGDQTVGNGPREAIKAGVGLVPLDRARSAAFATQSVRENVSIANLRAFWTGIRTSRRRERSDVAGWIEELQIKPADTEATFSGLSGGNQQKAILARWLRNKPRVLILDEPTQGVDVGAKAAIFEILARTAADGAGIVVCTAEAEDLPQVCDRVLVLRDGRLVAELSSGDSLTMDQIVIHTLAPGEDVEPVGSVGA